MGWFMLSREEIGKLTPFPTQVLLVVDGIKVSRLATRMALEIAGGTDSDLHLVCPVLTTPQRPYRAPSPRRESRQYWSGEDCLLWGYSKNTRG
jgi:hypothetical protein